MVQVLKNIGKAIRPTMKVVGTIANGVSLIAGVVSFGFAAADKIGEWTGKKNELEGELVNVDAAIAESEEIVADQTEEQTENSVEEITNE